MKKILYSLVAVSIIFSACQNNSNITTPTGGTSGCNDTIAINYNPNDTINSGCVYGLIGGAWTKDYEQYDIHMVVTSGGILLRAGYKKAKLHDKEEEAVKLLLMELSMFHYLTLTCLQFHWKVHLPCLQNYKCPVIEANNHAPLFSRQNAHTIFPKCIGANGISKNRPF